MGAIISARRNRHNRAFVCVNGLGYLTRTSAEAVRWEAILAVTHQTHVTTSTTTDAHGVNTTSTSTSHSYTVHCLDGRKICFDDTSCYGNIQALGVTMQVELARWHHLRGAVL